MRSTFLIITAKLQPAVVPAGAQNLSFASVLQHREESCMGGCMTPAMGRARPPSVGMGWTGSTRAGSSLMPRC
jgi:hypothetical protein